MSLLNGGFPIGSFLGIRFRIHWSLLLLMLWGASAMSPFVLLILATLFVTILIHELGHCFAARYLGGGAHEILLWPLGGLAFTYGADETPLKCLCVALAGPLTHIPTAMLCSGILSAAGHPLGLSDFNPLGGMAIPPLNEWLLYVYIVFRMQVLLFCFNVCLPAYPMDGGRVVVALLSMRLSLPRTVAIAATLTLASAAFLYFQDCPYIALFLAYEGCRLLVAATTPGLDWHPIARAFNSRPRELQLRSHVFVAPDIQLRPCPGCAKELHPRSEMCVHCGWKEKRPDQE